MFMCLADAAHAVGQEVSNDPFTARPDFFCSNCHKWLYAKRGCAFLYVPKKSVSSFPDLWPILNVFHGYRNQYIIKSSVPTSHAYVSPNDPDPPAPGDTHFVLQHECMASLPSSELLHSHGIPRDWHDGPSDLLKHRTRYCNTNLACTFCR